MVDAMKTQRWLRAAVGSLALLAILFSATAVVVPEGQSVFVTRFGRPVGARRGRDCTGSCPGRSTKPRSSTCGAACMRRAIPRCSRATRRTSSRARSSSGELEIRWRSSRRSAPRAQPNPSSTAS